MNINGKCENKFLQSGEKEQKQVFAIQRERAKTIRLVVENEK